jgi:4a-hydroxytetrahydrobiopterin dehydratase
MSDRRGKVLKLFQVIVFTGLVTLVVLKTNSGVYANQMVLNETAIADRMNKLTGWKHQDKQIVRTFTFKNFVEAIDFVNRLVEPAEKAGHHPDLAISYNKVTVSLTTHDAGGLTQNDFDLAEAVSKIYGK